MEKSFEIAELIVKKIKGTINSEEMVVLDKWVNMSSDNSSLYKRAIDTENQLNKLEVYNLFDRKKSWSEVENEIFQTPTVRFNSRRILSYAAVILLPIIIIGTAVFTFLGNKSQPTITSIDTVIKPGTQKAILVLADGGSFELDSEASSSELQQGDVRITNRNSSLVYYDEISRRKRQPLVYNELKTPNGGGYNLLLADGTEVWLNAGSSLRFPVSFTDSIRQVFLEGEAYFDVSHGKPFIVSSGNMDVRVLGTSFNISAYRDDSEMVTTLVEGKVRIDISGEDNSRKVSKVLTPNKQALLNKYLATVTIEDVNVAQYTSWMQGKLEFNNEDLEIVMKRLSRWYNFEYEFENTQAKGYHFSARINNTESISAILEMLEMTTDVKFEWKKNTIVVK